MGFDDVEEAVSMSAATSEAKQRSSVSVSFQVLAMWRRRPPAPVSWVRT